jgi:hypothetical protein
MQMEKGTNNRKPNILFLLYFAQSIGTDGPGSKCPSAAEPRATDRGVPPRDLDTARGTRERATRGVAVMKFTYITPNHI